MRDVIGVCQVVKRSGSGSGARSAIRGIVLGIAILIGLAALPAAALGVAPIALDKAGNGAAPLIAYDATSQTTFVAWNPPQSTGIDLCILPAGASACSGGGPQLLLDQPVYPMSPPTLDALAVLPGGGVAVIGDDFGEIAWTSPASGSAFMSSGQGLTNSGNHISLTDLSRDIDNVAPLSSTDVAMLGGVGADNFEDTTLTGGSPTLSFPNANQNGLGEFPGKAYAVSGTELAAEPAPPPAAAGTELVVGVSDNSEGPATKLTGCLKQYGTGFGISVGQVDGTSAAPGTLNDDPLPSYGVLTCSAAEPVLVSGQDGIGVVEAEGDGFDGTGSTYTIDYRPFDATSTGGTFGAPVELQNASNETGGTLVGLDAVDDAGTGVYTSWGDHQGLVLDYSPDGGANWDGPIVATPPASGFNDTVIAGISSGNAEIAFDSNTGSGTQVFLQSVDLGPHAPTNTAAPKLTGKPAAGKTLTCSTGGWANAPTSYAFQWYDDGTPIAGATGSKYKVTTLDEGTTLTCVVTASNAGGSGSASSKGDKVPVPFVAKCPGATGRLSGATLGLVKLGASRASEHYLYRHHSDRGKQYEDFFCLTPIGVRVGYGSPKLLKILTTKQRKALRDRVVWASTSNPFYSINGVRPGESITAASAVLHPEAPLKIGLNTWYLAVQKHSTAVLKVRGGVVEEIGIATNLLTASAHDQNVLMHSFY